MTRTLVSFLALGALAGALWAADAPKPPAHSSHPEVILARATTDGSGGVQLHLLVPAFRMEPLQRAVEKEGKKVEVKSQAVHQVGWRELTLPVDGKQVVVLDVRGKKVGAKSLPERLKQRTAVLLCVTGQPPDPFELQTTREDTLIVMAPMEKLVQGGPGRPPVGWPGAHPGKSFLEVGKSYRFQFSATPGDAVTGEVLELPCNGWVKVRPRGESGESWLNMARLREIVPAAAAAKAGG
jgi:hypothetical protein